MAKPETTACWFKDGHKAKWMPGHFHQWGSDVTIAGGTYTVGILEDENGAIWTVSPSWIHFGSVPDG